MQASLAMTLVAQSNTGVSHSWALKITAGFSCHLLSLYEKQLSPCNFATPHRCQLWGQNATPDGWKILLTYVCMFFNLMQYLIFPNFLPTFTVLPSTYVLHRTTRLYGPKPWPKNNLARLLTIFPDCERLLMVNQRRKTWWDNLFKYAQSRITPTIEWNETSVHMEIQSTVTKFATYVVHEIMFIFNKVASIIL